MRPLFWAATTNLFLPVQLAEAVSVALCENGSVVAFGNNDSGQLELPSPGGGSMMSGQFSLHFDGSDVGLSSSSENVDALAHPQSATIMLSTAGGVSVPGVVGTDEDVLEVAAVLDGWGALRPVPEELRRHGRLQGGFHARRRGGRRGSSVRAQHQVSNSRRGDMCDEEGNAFDGYPAWLKFRVGVHHDVRVGRGAVSERMDQD